MISGVLVILFWPWMRAWTAASYESYTKSDLYQRLYDIGGMSKAFQRWEENIDLCGEHAISALKTQWPRILFLPWTILTPVDFSYVRMKETK
jgi:hypothetical protein